MNPRPPSHAAPVGIDSPIRSAIIAAMAPKIDPDKYMTVGNAAKLANVSRMWMRTLIKDGHVTGLTIDGQYFALRTAVVAYAKTVPPTGRPRGGAHGN